MTLQDVVEHDEAIREFIRITIQSVWPLPGWQKLSFPARIAFLAIGQGMRLAIDRTKSKRARLVDDPEFSRFLKHPIIPVPDAVAKEMIESGLMKRLDYPDRDLWCMIQ